MQTSSENVYTPQSGTAVYRREKATIPTAFIIITIIVGSLWYLYTLGSFSNILTLSSHLSPVTVPTTEPLGTIVIVSPDMVVGEEARIGTGIIKITEEEASYQTLYPRADTYIVTDAIVSPHANTHLVLGKSAEGSDVRLVQYDEVLREDVISMYDDTVLLGHPVWSDDGSYVAYARSILTETIGDSGVTQEVARQEIVEYSPQEQSEQVVGEGIPVAVTSGGEMLFIRADDVLMRRNGGGEVFEIETLGASLSWQTQISPDGSHAVLIADEFIVFLHIDPRSLEIVAQMELEGAYADVIFNTENDALFLDDSGALSVLLYDEEEGYSRMQRYSDISLPKGATFVEWNN